MGRAWTRGRVSIWRLPRRCASRRQKAPSAWRVIQVELAEKEATFRYRLRRDKPDRLVGRQARRREGRYLLRTNLTETDPAKLWYFYLQLVAVEEAFKNLKEGSGYPSRPSTRSTHRGTHLHPVPPKSITSVVIPVHRLPRLLLARHAESTIAPPGTGIDPAQSDREVCRRADARCVRTEHRRLGADPHPLHPA